MELLIDVRSVVGEERGRGLAVGAWAVVLIESAGLLGKLFLLATRDVASEAENLGAAKEALVDIVIGLEERRGIVNSLAKVL